MQGNIRTDNIPGDIGEEITQIGWLIRAVQHLYLILAEVLKSDGIPADTVLGPQQAEVDQIQQWELALLLHVLRHFLIELRLEHCAGGIDADGIWQLEATGDQLGIDGSSIQLRGFPFEDGNDELSHMSLSDLGACGQR